MEFFDNPKKLFPAALGLFIGLTLVVAIAPAIHNQENNAPLPNAISLSEDALAGKRSFVANGCVACHTQQVRNLAMDKVWGSRPSIAADYAANTRMDRWRNTATLMGTERTGPDLSNTGQRQPSLEWNLLHLYQPRAVVAQSVMPAYPWLFETRDQVGSDETEVTVPDEFKKDRNKKIVATREALQLVAYLQSLKQTPLPGGSASPAFLYAKEADTPVAENTGSVLPDGKLLYANNCQSCHQANGEGLKGAFPPLKGSPVVLGDDLELYVSIIMNGYDARPEYAVMNAVGTDNRLSPEQVTAIINHERSSWGNTAKAVDVEEVRKLVDALKVSAKQ
jgi:cytochrome c oxidase cbb3-type subunit 2